MKEEGHRSNTKTPIDLWTEDNKERERETTFITIFFFATTKGTKNKFCGLSLALMIELQRMILTFS